MEKKTIVVASSTMENQSKFSRPPRYDRFGTSPYCYAVSATVVILTNECVYVNNYFYFFYDFSECSLRHTNRQAL